MPSHAMNILNFEKGGGGSPEPPPAYAPADPSYYLDVYLYFELYPEFAFKVGCFLRSGHLVYENRSRSMCVFFFFLFSLRDAYY